MAEWPTPPQLHEVALGKSGNHGFEGDFEEFRDHFIGTARATWLELTSPHGDAPPMLGLARDDHVTLIRIPGEWFNGRASKTALIKRVITPLVIAGGVRFVGISTANWVVTNDSPAGQELERLRNAGKPTPSFDELGLDGVIEEACVNAYEYDHHEFWQTRITRLEAGAPLIGKYKQFSQEEGDMTGLFVEPVLEALEVARSHG